MGQVNVFEPTFDLEFSLDQLFFQTIDHHETLEYCTSHRFQLILKLIISSVCLPVWSFYPRAHCALILGNVLVTVHQSNTK